MFGFNFPQDNSYLESALKYTYMKQNVRVNRDVRHTNQNIDIIYT